MVDPYAQLLDERRSEAASRGLAKLPHDFYRSMTNYLAEVRRTFESELRENPSSRKGELARQTYQRAGQVARDLVEARMTKLLSLAFQAAVGGSRELTNSLPEERGLFDLLVQVLGEHRSSVAPYLATAGPPTPGRTAAAPERPPAGPPPKPPGPPGEMLVRILKESKPLAIGAETIELRREDLVSLPEATARILIEARIAEPVTPRPPTG